MPNPADASLGGQDTRTWRWHQTLNIFHDGGQFPAVPDPSVVTAPRWLSWSAYTRDSGPHGPQPSDHFSVALLTPNNESFRTYYGVANVTPELESAMVPFYGNAEKIRRSVTPSDNGATNTNTVASWASFDTAAGALSGTAACLTEQVQPLRQWRDRVGHRGDELQGGGAAAFWLLLDDFAFKCENLVTQITRERAAWDALTEAKNLLRHAGVSLEHAYQRWTGAETFTYDTGLGFSVTAPGSALAWPAGAIRAIWESPQVRQDFSNQHVDLSAGAQNYPASSLLGGAVNSDALWLTLESAAKKIWIDHQVVLLDSPAASATGLVATAYEVAARYLPAVAWPNRPHELPSGGNGSGGSGGGNGGGDDDSQGNTVVVNSPPPSRVDVRSTVTRTGQYQGAGGSFGGGLLPGGGPNPLLRVPGGSFVAPNGVVIGPDGRPVLGGDGRPIIVPPGSRVNANGEIIGPRGDGRLEQKDRVRNPYALPQPSPPGNQESALERHLRSLRTPPRTVPEPFTGLAKGDLAGALGTGLKLESAGRVGVTSNLPSSAFGAAPNGKIMTSAGGATAGTSGQSLLPVPLSGAGARAKNERDRASWLAEDEETWGTTPGVAPAVLGGRRRPLQRRPANVRISGGIARVQSPELGLSLASGQGTSSSTSTATE